jgi:hypothetical protein
VGTSASSTDCTLTACSAFASIACRCAGVSWIVCRGAVEGLGLAGAWDAAGGGALLDCANTGDDSTMPNTSPAAAQVEIFMFVF